jgi:biopolymer transport protein ExbD
MFLEDQPVTLDQLPAQLKAAQESGRTVAMKADKKAPFGTVIRIIESLRAAGVRALPAFTESDENR